MCGPLSNAPCGTLCHDSCGPNGVREARARAKAKAEQWLQHMLAAPTTRPPFPQSDACYHNYK